MKINYKSPNLSMFNRVKRLILNTIATKKIDNTLTNSTVHSNNTTSPDVAKKRSVINIKQIHIDRHKKNRTSSSFEKSLFKHKLKILTHHNEYSDTGGSVTKISDTVVSHGKFNSFSLMPFPSLEYKRSSMLKTLSQRIEENVKQWKETMKDRHFTFKTKNYRVPYTISFK